MKFDRLLIRPEARQLYRCSVPVYDVIPLHYVLKLIDTYVL